MLTEQKKERVPVTVVLLTLNEEFNLPGAIESVHDWAEEIFIVDSCSTDKTVDVALNYGVRIVQRKFTNYGDQWNWAIEHLPIKTPWILKLDADERLTEELKENISIALKTGGACNGYEMILRLWFMGRPLHVRQSALRLWRTGKCRFSDVIVNEHLLIEGPVGKMKGLMEHYDSRDLHHWWDKQNRYTTMEAIMRLRGDALAEQPRLFGSSLNRRMLLKKYFFHIPFRYQLLFIHEVIIRGAWRSGWVGLRWARLRVQVNQMIEWKVLEARMSGKYPQLPPSRAGAFDPRIIASQFQQLLSQKEPTPVHERMKAATDSCNATEQDSRP
jgi:glycosyltransferase involved in cell wall biosynthesis